MSQKREWERIEREMSTMESAYKRLRSRLEEIRARCKHEWHRVHRLKERSAWKCCKCGATKVTKGEDKP